MSANLSYKAQIKVLIAENLAIAAVIFFMLTALIAYIGLFIPVIKDIRQADRTLALEDERQAKTSYLEKLSKLFDNYAAVPAEEAARLQAMIPPEEDMPGVLATLEAAANAAQVGLLSVSFSKTALEAGAGDQFKQMNVNMMLGNASFSRFRLFLESLENNLRLLDVKNISLDPKGKSYSIQFRAYYLKKS